MFTKILIANRGEIACRIIKSARRMGIRSVAVYSDADRDALHVEMADEAVAIGPPPAGQSYLDQDRIIAACLETGAEAVHPGYGFLSERAAFATALAEKGLVFIGPNPAAIAAMGDKIESKKAAAAAGVSTVPGHLGAIADARDAVAIAQEIGFPVMIKASAGGGGKGMRIARDVREVAEGFRLAASEAMSSFGDDRLLIEKFIVDPRHVEIQVLGDKHGVVIHLGERECSIQRRNQKIVEEAPSPLVDPAMRARMGAEAVALGKAVGYDSAGTVEFVVGQDKSFYFLEMNTRLQVEHPVTELVTGVDLVEEMIRVAAGEKLRLSQKDIELRGWAVEARIYAEDPVRGFLPSVGRLRTYRPPEERRGPTVTVRNDTGVFEGSEITIHYDPMIAKLVTHAPHRLAAIDAMADALDSFAIDGVRHNIPFLSVLMQHPRWREGRLSTAFLTEEFREGFVAPVPDAASARCMVAVAAAIDYLHGSRRRRIAAQMTDTARPAMRERVAMADGEEYQIEVDEGQGEIQVTFLDAEGGPQGFETVRSRWRPGEPVWRGEVEGRAVAMAVRPIVGGSLLCHRGASLAIRIHAPTVARLARLMPAKAKAETGRALRCPMPGLVRSIEVAEGQDVKAGEALCVVEAMKMENVLRAERDATVKSIVAKVGDILAVDAVIMDFVG
jgi:propionyl-CoA carboxylase alpha chain